MNDATKIRGVLSTREAILSAIPLRIGVTPRTRELVVEDILTAFPNLILEPPANLYRIDRPRTRGTDPATSAAAAEAVAAHVRRPGGKIHRVLAAYADVASAGVRIGSYPDGAATAREIEFVANVKAAHKRTSELLADGLLEVVTDDAGDDRVRNGGRLLRITDDGRRELARLNREGKVREERRRAREERRRKREATRA